MFVIMMLMSISLLFSMEDNTLKIEIFAPPKVSVAFFQNDTLMKNALKEAPDPKLLALQNNLATKFSMDVDRNEIKNLKVQISSFGEDAIISYVPYAQNQNAYFPDVLQAESFLVKVGNTKSLHNAQNQMIAITTKLAVYKK